jgi:hypothetical protein
MTLNAPVMTSLLSLFYRHISFSEIMYSLMKNSTLTLLDLSDNQIGVKEVSLNL